MSIAKNAKELVEMYQSGTFLMLNEGIMKEIGINPTVALSVLLTRFNYHASRNELDSEDMFYLDIPKMEELTTLKYKVQKSVLDKLETMGLIKVSHKTGNKRYIQILIDAVRKLIEKFSKSVSKVENDKKQENNSNDQQQNQNCPEGNSRNAQTEKPDIPQGQNLIYKTGYIKPIIKQIIKPKHNITSCNKSSSSYSSSKKENQKQKMSEKYESALTEFLTAKGISNFTIKQTINQFEDKGLIKFNQGQLEDAYKKYVHYNQNIEPVMYFHSFFANGVEMSNSIPAKQEQPKKAYEMTHLQVLAQQRGEYISDCEINASEPVFYNWLEA